ncbi:MAG: tetratricopeptide repeat protein [Patescibacteria group bacterium]|nr:tetratricopeptide repeat protein [Patescibacteria group bacterium]
MTEAKTNEESSKKVPALSSKSSSGLDFIISGVIALIFFLCPIFFTGLVAQGLGFEKMILLYFLVLVGVVAWVTKGVILGELNLKRTPLDIPIITTLVLFGISTILSISVKDSLIGSYGSSAKGFAAVFIFVLFYYLVVNNLNLKRVKSVFWAFVFSSILLVVYSLLQLMQIYIIPFDLVAARSFNPIGSVSGLAIYIVSILPILVVAATQIKSISPKMKSPLALVLKVFIGIGVLASLAVLMLLSGFTFWPISIVGMVIVLMFFLSKIIKISSNNLIIPLGVFLALIIFLVLGNFNFINLQLPSEVSLSRGASWDIAKDALKDNPLFGSGPSTFYYNFSKFKSGDFNDSVLWNVRFDSASGALFEFLATVGILGTVSVIILVLISFSVTFLALIKTKKSEVHSILLALFASMISFLLFSLLFAVNNSVILMTAIIFILGISVSLVLQQDRFAILNLSFRASPKYALALAAIFLCVSAGVVIMFTMGLKMYLADVYAKQAIVAPKSEEKIEKLEKAVELAPYQDAYYLNLANNYMAIANQGALAGKDQTEIGANLSQAIENGKKAVNLSENRAGNNEALALIYENASFYTRGALEWSEQLYAKVKTLDPKNPVPDLRMALINMARANAETDTEEQKYYIGEAVKKYDDSIKLKGDLAAAYYGKAIAHEKLGENDDAIEQLKRANLVSRNNLDYRFELGRLYFNRGVSQPNIAQDDFAEISKNDLKPDVNQGTSTPERPLSVSPDQATGNVVAKNADMDAAEQLFLSIVAANPNHANALYSLAVLYQKTGQNDNALKAINRLLTVVKDAKTTEAIKAQFSGILQ